MGKGYKEQADIEDEYWGFQRLIQDTRERLDYEFGGFLGDQKNGKKDPKDTSLRRKTITMAYYPDGKQEGLIKKFKLVFNKSIWRHFWHL